MSTNVYRAIVSYSSNATGDIKVRIPAKFGPETTVDISRIGRTAYNGSWSVPSIGSQIVVTADDEAFTNVFWIQTNPDEAVSLTGVQSDISDLETSVSNLTSSTNSSISTINSQISTINSQITELQAYKDASLLGIFN